MKDAWLVPLIALGIAIYYYRYRPAVATPDGSRAMRLFASFLMFVMALFIVGVMTVLPSLVA